MELTEFAFEDNVVRSYIDEDGNPWFIAKDVLAVLELDRKALERLDEDEKGVNSIHTLGGDQNVRTVNESGLYSLILGSRKPEAKAFKKWVTSEVLPSIRKTGAYAVGDQPTFSHVSGRARNAGDRLFVLDAAMSAMRLSNVARVGLTRKTVERVHPESLEDLPTTAVNNPESGSSSWTHAPLTSFLKKYTVNDEEGVAHSVQSLNKHLAKHGYLEKMEYTLNGGKESSYWSITDRGEEYGANEVYVEHPNITQPKWYHRKFKGLMQEVGMTVSAKEEKPATVKSPRKPKAKSIF